MNQASTVFVVGLVLFALGFAAYDVWVYYKGGIPATISHGLWKAGQKYPLVPFVFGLVVGGLAVHWWGW